MCGAMNGTDHANGGAWSGAAPAFAARAPPCAAVAVPLLLQSEKIKLHVAFCIRTVEYLCVPNIQ